MDKEGQTKNEKPTIPQNWRKRQAKNQQHQMKNHKGQQSQIEGFK